MGWPGVHTSGSVPLDLFSRMLLQALRGLGRARLVNADVVRAEVRAFTPFLALMPGTGLHPFSGAYAEVRSFPYFTLSTPPYLWRLCRSHCTKRRHCVTLGVLRAACSLAWLLGGDTSFA